MEMIGALLKSDLRSYRQVWRNFIVSCGSDSTTIDMSMRAEAALFFKLVLGSEHSGEGQLSLVRFMMIMTDKDVVGIYLEEGDSMTSKELIKRCQETQRRILTRCAGLLEVADSGGRQSPRSTNAAGINRNS